MTAINDFTPVNCGRCGGFMFGFRGRKRKKFICLRCKKEIEEDLPYFPLSERGAELLSKTQKGGQDERLRASLRKLFEDFYKRSGL